MGGGAGLHNGLCRRTMAAVATSPAEQAEQPASNTYFYAICGIFCLGRIEAPPPLLCGAESFWSAPAACPTCSRMYNIYRNENTRYAQTSLVKCLTILQQCSYQLVEAGID